MPTEKLERDDHVRLLSPPDGYSSTDVPLTVGNTYIFRYYDGSNVCTSTDRAGLDLHYNRDRVEKVEKKSK